MKQQLGRLETQLLAYAQLRELPAVATGDLVNPLRITKTQERELFRRMARGKLIARVRPGLYLVPPRLPLGGVWSPGEALALNALIEDRAGRYQICGPNAFNRYKFDEQVPSRVYVYNNRISGARKIGAVAMMLIKVSDERLGDVEKVMMPDGTTAVYSSRVRTLVDAVYDWSRFNTLPRAFKWIRRELAARRVTATRLVECTLAYGNMGTIRRMGLLLEQAGIAPALLRKLERALGPSTSLIPWIPNRPKRGVVKRRWGVVLNGES